MPWRLKACRRCKGDLYWNDDGEWVCFQCGNRPVLALVGGPKRGNRSSGEGLVDVLFPVGASLCEDVDGQARKGGGNA